VTRVALITNGISSTVHSSLELARRLQARGHDVTLVSHADIAATIESNGFPFIALTADRRAFDELHHAMATIRRGTPRARLAALVRLPITARRTRRTTVEADELLTLIPSLRPDLLVIDIEAHFAIVATSQLGVPTALTTFLFAIEQRRGVPPIDSWSEPGDDAIIRDEWERVHRSSFLAARRRRWSRQGLVDHFGPISYSTTSRDALRAVARRAGFDVSAHTDTTQWLRPHGYSGLPVLTTNLRELEFGDGASEEWHYVGPMVCTDRKDAAIEHEDLQRWHAVRERRRTEPGRPLIYCSLGSYWNADIDLLGRIVDVARRRSEWDLVIGLGGRGDPAALGAVPPNVCALRWAPQVEVLAEADAAIVHGGSASLNECVVQGTPMLVCSTGHLDQNGVASRVRVAEIGVACDGQRVDSETIEAHLDRLLGDRSIRAEIERLRDLARQPSRLDLAVDLLEAIASSRPSGRRA